MSDYLYPTNDLDNPDKLLSLLGSFWATAYTGNAFIQDIASVKGHETQETYLKFLEVIRSISRYNVPVFSKKTWFALKVKESDFLKSRESNYFYQTGTSLACGANARGAEKSAEQQKYQSDIGYGDKTLKEFFSVKLPDRLIRVPQIQNSVLKPSLTLLNSVDFEVRKHSLIFNSDIFQDDRWPKRDILNAAGDLVDRECVLWVYNGSWDLDKVYSQFGYALSLKMKSSQGYKDFINAVFDCFVYGSNVRSQARLISSAFGLPTIKAKREKVEEIFTYGNSHKIVTDLNVYVVPSSTTLTVSKGQVLKEGDFLTDSLQVYELNRGLTDDINLEALTVEEGLLSFGFFHGITFENTDKPLNVETGVAGKTKISWELGGFDYDVEKFWDDVHSNGISSGTTIANLLDLRKTPSTEPTAQNLPQTINPLKFLVDNLLRNNAYVVKLKLRDCENRLKFFPVSQFKKAQPPHSLMILILDLNYCDSGISLEHPGTPESPGAEEQASGFACMVVEEPDSLLSKMSERIRSKIIGGRCI